MPNLYGRTLAELEAVASELDAPAYLACQLAEWIYGRNERSFSAMTNISTARRTLLEDRYEITVTQPASTTRSADGTVKHLFDAGRGKYVEAASIPEERRHTLCLSTQVGCKMGCLFCMTAKQGFHGNLDAGDILAQYAGLPERDAVTNIVYMGMGEPLDNLEPVLQSLEVFTADWGYAFAPRRITVSTVGLVPAMKRLLEETEVRLAVSLHSPFEEERRRLMPVQHVYPITDVVAFLRGTNESRRRRISFEYIVFGGVNDTPRHAKEIVRICEGLSVRINLIPYHQVPGTSLRPAEPAAMEAFRSELKTRGMVATIRRSRGQDIDAACGLLSTKALTAGGVEKDW